MSKKNRETKKPKAGIRSDVQEIAYHYEDKIYGKLGVRNSSNAWWMDQGKLHGLVQGFRMGFNDREACSFVGITKDNLDYFVEIHPHFSDFFDGCKLNPRTIAKVNIYQGLTAKDSKVNLPTSQWYAEHRMQDEHSTRAQLTGADNKPLSSDLDDDQVKDIAESVLESLKLKKQTENE